MKILIVEDEVTIAKIYTHLAMERGHTHIAWASSAMTAIEYAMRDTYEFILLDVQIPGGGAELQISTQLRKLNPHAVIAVISGSLPDQLPPEAAACIDVGIAKPIHALEFGQLLAAAERVQVAVDQVRSLGRTWKPSTAIGGHRALAMANGNPERELSR